MKLPSHKRGRCPICRRMNRDPKFPYCLNCTTKLNGRRPAKKPGECKYGRCHRKVYDPGFFSGNVSDYCPQHHQQALRGLIR